MSTDEKQVLVLTNWATELHQRLEGYREPSALFGRQHQRSVGRLLKTLNRRVFLGRVLAAVAAVKFAVSGQARAAAVVSRKTVRVLTAKQDLRRLYLAYLQTQGQNRRLRWAFCPIEAVERGQNT
jgi:hypothetical protein